jgi:hypothetical protein
MLPLNSRAAIAEVAANASAQTEPISILDRMTVHPFTSLPSFALVALHPPSALLSDFMSVKSSLLFF